MDDEPNGAIFKAAKTMRLMTKVTPKLMNSNGQVDCLFERDISDEDSFLKTLKIKYCH